VILFFLGFDPALVGWQDTRRDENPSGSGVYSLAYTPVLDNGFIVPFLCALFLLLILRGTSLLVSHSC
jgi:hypothetical protein